MPVAASPLQPSLLRDQVADTLRAAIAEMSLVPGERITERHLVEVTGVSRATVREALRQLAAEGVLTAVPQRGVTVPSLTRQEASELYEIRAVLEGLAGQLCARRADDADLRLLRERYESLRHILLASPDIKEQLRAKAAFYEVLLACSGNATIIATLSPLQAKITALRAATMSIPGRPARVITELGAILDAIARHDEAGAFTACVYHVREAARNALRILDERRPVTAGRGATAAARTVPRSAPVS